MNPDEQAKAAQKLGKAGQELAKLGQDVVQAGREFGGFISQFVSGPLEQGIGIFEDKLKYMRWERQARSMRRAQNFMQESGFE